MDFYKRVAIVCRMVPAGRAATYGQIALLCEKPQNSRQVGYALNRRITDELLADISDGGEISGIPAHRIMNHQGYLSGASAFEHQDMQKWHLEDEGITVDFDVAKQKYRVNLKKFKWQPGIEDVGKIKELFKKKNC
ncbi:MAG: MGMT family protein [Lachnospiraceae bacterium]|nr:MGMT family protein [Lachnospiraceae bacterium]